MIEVGISFSFLFSLREIFDPGECCRAKGDGVGRFAGHDAYEDLPLRGHDEVRAEPAGEARTGKNDRFEQIARLADHTNRNQVGSEGLAGFLEVELDRVVHPAARTHLQGGSVQAAREGAGRPSPSR